MEEGNRSNRFKRNDAGTHHKDPQGTLASLCGVSRNQKILGSFHRSLGMKNQFNIIKSKWWSRRLQILARWNCEQLRARINFNRTPCNSNIQIEAPNLIFLCFHSYIPSIQTNWPKPQTWPWIEFISSACNQSVCCLFSASNFFTICSFNTPPFGPSSNDLPPWFRCTGGQLDGFHRISWITTCS